MRVIFFTKDGQVRIPWRILSMAALTIAAIFLINKGWRALGLPGQRTASELQMLAMAILIVGATLAIVLFLLRRFEQRGSDAIWLPFDASAWQQTAIGTALGAVPITLIVLLSLVFGFGEIAAGGLDASALVKALLPTLLTVFLFAAFEEFTLRGYLLRQIALARGPLFAVIVTGVLFGLMHSGNPGANWQGLAYTAIGGILMGLLLLRTGSLWLLVGYHFGWNAVSGNLFGLSVSGMDVQASVALTTLSGSDWLTGGSYGFESALPTVLCEILVLSIALFTIRNSDRRFVL